jgi:hypothetical protein
MSGSGNDGPHPTEIHPVNRSLPYATGGAAFALIAVVAIVVGGCVGPTVAVEGTPMAAPPTAPAYSTAEQTFLAGVADGPEINWPSTDEEKLRLGRAIGVDSPTRTREQMIARLMAPPKPWPQRPSEIVVDQAKLNLCPGTPWAPVSTYVPPSLEEARDVGPRDVIKVDGQWHVGTEETDHVLPGRYRTNGSTGFRLATGPSLTRPTQSTPWRTTSPTVRARCS